MSDVKPSYPKFSYDEHARTCAPDDFLGQARRTVRGVRLAEEQLQMIASAIDSGLELTGHDVLLELACGNGALTHYLFGSCKEYVGVDISEYLISIAKTNFEMVPHYRYVVSGAIEYLHHELDPSRFSKVLCYAGFQYFSATEAADLLRLMHDKFTGVERIFLGNLPDRDHAADFYTTRLASAEELADCSTAMGVWRTQGELTHLAATAGWEVKFSKMPTAFHAAYYRYDALLQRENKG